jgi:hypothetical protein
VEKISEFFLIFLGAFFLSFIKIYKENSLFILFFHQNLLRK